MRDILDAQVKRFGDALEAFPWEDRDRYAQWLAQTYYYVRHSTRLLAAAAARFPFDEGGNALHSRFANHMAEEKSHERLAEHDLKQLGLALASFPELPATRQLYEPQYYKIEHQSPLALFGYILPLEAIGPALGSSIIARVSAAHGSKCCTFLNVHSEEDVDHVEKAFAMVAGLSAPHTGYVHDNIEQTVFAYVTMLSSIASPAVTLSSAAAPHPVSP